MANSFKIYVLGLKYNSSDRTTIVSKKIKLFIMISMS